MNPIPELGSMLKQLRLSGILDSIEARNREAIDLKIPYWTAPGFPDTELRCMGRLESSNVEGSITEELQAGA